MIRSFYNINSRVWEAIDQKEGLGMSISDL